MKNSYTKLADSRTLNVGTLIDGLLQMALSIIVIGWVWSVIFGFALYRKAQWTPRLSVGR